MACTCAVLVGVTLSRYQSDTEIGHALNCKGIYPPPLGACKGQVQPYRATQTEQIKPLSYRSAAQTHHIPRFLVGGDLLSVNEDNF